MKRYLDRDTILLDQKDPPCNHDPVRPFVSFDHLGFTRKLVYNLSIRSTGLPSEFDVNMSPYYLSVQQKRINKDLTGEMIKLLMSSG